MLSGGPSVVRLHLFRMTRYLIIYWRYFNKTSRKYLSHEWALLKKFSKVKGQRSRSYVYKCANTVTAEEYISTSRRRGLLVYNYILQHEFFISL